ncbi:glycosyltransferase family 1 protein [Spirosoma terrae]|uniref:Glycosyltransferase family 4 protein n=1 Tax=Spirosoma terrae TaxID=1968276 RepID=A0A6L9LBX4_9BACT|nr:glycosyltransferase family 1 protein [Spirosoma terrae]NDU98044.1 glycosyltransferase family 4 protein [Spirosoma terrae]
MPSLFLETERMTNINSGLGQVCLHLGQELVRQRPSDWELTFLVPPEQVGVFGNSVQYKVAKKWHRYWNTWKFDVWHCLHQGSKFLPVRPSKLIYTILDLNYLSLPEYSEKRKRQQKKHYQRCIDKAYAITTISHYVATDVRKQLVVPKTKLLKAIHLGVTIPTNIPTISAPIELDGPFLFFIGMLQPYKNVHTLLPLLAANPAYRLVLAGPDKPAYSQQIRQQAQQMGVLDRLIIPGPIDDPTKWWLYAHCDAFLFPSLLEGFGLPVVEAMAFGKPVFTSPLTSLPEVGGSEAFYFPSFDAQTMVDTFQHGMTTYRNDPSMPERLKQQSAKFRWDLVAADYWTLYKQVLGTSS